MASPPFQIVAFFTDLDGRGWSEKYWTSTNMGGSQAADFAANFTTFRMTMATTSIRLQHVRIGSAVGRSPFAFFPTNAQGATGLFTPPTLPSDVGFLMELTSTERYVNRVFLRGLPESVIQLEERVANGPWDNAFSGFVGFLKSTNLIVIRTVLGTFQAQHTIIKATASSPKGIRLVIAPGDTLTEGQVIRLHGANIPGYNGLKTVLRALTPDALGPAYLLGGASPISDVALGVLMYWTGQTIKTPALADAVIAGVTNRKVGRPFGLARGRARTLFNLRP